MKIKMETLEAKSDQLNAVDLISEMTFTIERADYKPADQQPVHIHFVGHPGRPYKPSKGMLRGLTKAWGMETDDWATKQMTIFCNPDIKWAGKEVGGIQISAISGINGDLKFPLRINRSQTVMHTFRAIKSKIESRNFIFNHWELLINNAKSEGEIATILRELKLEFPENLGDLIQTATDRKLALSHE